MKLPALQFYGGDWHKDPGIKALGYFDRGVWFEMLLMMHESEERGVLLLNGLPMSDEALQQALKLDNQIFKDTLTKLLTYGVARRRESDGAIYSKRMVEDEKLRKIRKEAGKMGGNPNLVNQNTTTQLKQKPTPSSSFASSSTKQKQDAQKAGHVDEVFNCWKQELNHPEAGLDKKRKALIAEALKNYSVENLKLAIKGCSKSSWHMGKNDRNKRYDALSLILRDADHIDSFIKCAKGNSGYVPPVIQQPPRKVVIQNPEIIKAALQKAKETVGVKNDT